MISPTSLIVSGNWYKISPAGTSVLPTILMGSGNWYKGQPTPGQILLTVLPTILIAVGIGKKVDPCWDKYC